MIQVLYLDDRKVLRRFGKHPERGAIIGGASPSKNVTIASPTQVFSKVDYTTKVTVRCVIALNCVGKGKWIARCPNEYRQYVEWWLQTHCGHGKVNYDYRTTIKR